MIGIDGVLEVEKGLFEAGIGVQEGLMGVFGNLMFGDVEVFGNVVKIDVLKLGPFVHVNIDAILVVENHVFQKQIYAEGIEQLHCALKMIVFVFLEGVVQ